MRRKKTAPYRAIGDWVAGWETKRWGAKSKTERGRERGMQGWRRNQTTKAAAFFLSKPCGLNTSVRKKSCVHMPVLLLILLQKPWAMTILLRLLYLALGELVEQLIKIATKKPQVEKNQLNQPCVNWNTLECAKCEWNNGLHDHSTSNNESECCPQSSSVDVRESLQCGRHKSTKSTQIPHISRA